MTYICRLSTKIILKKKLGNIAALRTGVWAKPHLNGDVVYLQAKHFDEEGNVAAKLHPDLFIEEISQKHFLQPGDIIFAAKGIKNFAAIFEAHNQPAVASTSFFVISLSDDGVLPEYLAWFLNHTETQKYLKTFARGTSIASISKSVLEDLEIPVPDISIQKTILKISELRKRERTLIREIDELKEQQIQQKIMNSINK